MFSSQSYILSINSCLCHYSPYTTPIFHLIIGSNNVQYPIHQYFLEQSPEWAGICKSGPWGNKIWLPDVDEDVSHALVHYLYTGAYQTLKPSDVSAVASDDTTGHEGDDKASRLDRLLEYKRSVRLYCLAKTYGLFRLETLSMVRIESFKDGISIWDTLDIAEEAYKKLPITAEWISMYLKEKMQAAINGDKHLLIRKKFLDRIGRTAEFDKAMMKIIAHIYTGESEPEEDQEEDEVWSATI